MTLQSYEAAFLERLEAEGNTLGWKPAGRDQTGQAMMRVAKAQPDGTELATYLTITARGLVYSTPVFERDGKQVSNSRLALKSEAWNRKEFGRVPVS